MKIKTVMFVIIGLMLMCPDAGATNDIVGDMQVAYIDATQGIPGTMCSVTDTSPHVSYLLLSYNETQSCVDIYKNSSLTGKVFCGGFVPAVDTKYAINLSIVSPSSNNNVEFTLPHARLIVQRYTTGNYKIINYYTDDNDASNSTYFTVTAENVTDDKITINITSNNEKLSLYAINSSYNVDCSIYDYRLKYNCKNIFNRADYTT